jgi:magnesium transporter
MRLPKEVRRYFRDVADHNNRVVDRVTAYDDLLNSILQAHLAQVAVDQNNDMRKIASWAAIAALQTAFAEIDGTHAGTGMALRLSGAAHRHAHHVGPVYRYLRRAGWL